jgi:hypothetical protein
MQKNYKLLSLIAGLIVLSCVMIGYFVVGYFSLIEFSKATADNDFLISGKRYAGSLDGQSVKTKNQTVSHVVGVMVETHPDARPMIGFSKAKIVYEAPVEGSFTRYLAIFDSNQSVPKIGPVRSARPYFIDWLQEYGAGLYMHSGGSPEALSLIKSRNIFDANEFYWGEYYWRDQARFAPHNLYTSSDNWKKILDQYGNNKELFIPAKAWKYAAIVGKTLASDSKLNIDFNSNYGVMWNYDPKSLLYVRSINGNKEKDADGAGVFARNVIVQFTDVNLIAGDDSGRKTVRTLGTGKAMVLKKGSIITGTWEKKGLTDRTRFYDKNYREILLAPGNTWVEVVPTDAKISS